MFGNHRPSVFGESGRRLQQVATDGQHAMGWFCANLTVSDGYGERRDICISDRAHQLTLYAYVISKKRP